MFSSYELSLVNLLLRKYGCTDFDDSGKWPFNRMRLFDSSLISSAVASKTIKFLFFKSNRESCFLLPWFINDTAFLVYSVLVVGILATVSGVFAFGLVVFMFIIIITKLWTMPLIKDLEIELLEIQVELEEIRLEIKGDD